MEELSISSINSTVLLCSLSDAESVESVESESVESESVEGNIEVKQLLTSQSHLSHIDSHTDMEVKLFFIIF